MQSYIDCILQEDHGFKQILRVRWQNAFGSLDRSQSTDKEGASGIADKVKHEDFKKAREYSALSWNL